MKRVLEYRIDWEVETGSDFCNCMRQQPNRKSYFSVLSVLHPRRLVYNYTFTSFHDISILIVQHYLLFSPLESI